MQRTLQRGLKVPEAVAGHGGGWCCGLDLSLESIIKRPQASPESVTEPTPQGVDAIVTAPGGTQPSGPGV